MKIFISLLFLTLFLGPLSVKAAVEIKTAKILLEEILLELNPAIQEQGLQIELNYDSKAKIPSAFAKWISPKKIGQITFNESFFALNSLSQASLGLILCHEVGHFLGGRPFVTAPKPQGIFNFGNKFPNMSAEGQADFFATAYCLPRIKKLLKLEHNTPSLLEIQNCEGSLECQEDLNIIGQTVSTYAEIMAFLNIVTVPTESTDYSHDRPDETIKNPGAYPSLSCRAETLRSGLSCQDFEEEGNCSNLLELRPKCWFVD